jgi:NAD dependent epimerase/dehydratase family enzyme
MSGTSLVIGSTGLIGTKLIFELAKKDSEVIAITRRSISNLPENVSLLDINFDDFLENGSLPSCDHLYICLGTTIKKVVKVNLKKLISIIAYLLQRKQERLVPQKLV